MQRAAFVAAFLAGRLTAPVRLPGDRVPSDQRVARYEAMKAAPENKDDDARWKTE